MKRSAALEPLSHDHHAGLAFVARLRAAQRGGADPAPLAAELAAFWHDHLVPHFADEEAYVLPILEHGAAPLAAQMVDEHRQIRQLVEDVRTEPPSWDGPLGTVAGALAAHIRFEERHAFPAAERLAGDDTLARIGTQIHHAHTSRTPSP
jgi:hemerythrin-like domain-containing protein